MNLLPIILLSIVVVAIAIVVFRKWKISRAVKAATELAEEIKNLLPYQEQGNTEQGNARTGFIDIPTSLHTAFCGKIISTSQAKGFADFYLKTFQKAKSIAKTLEAFQDHIAPDIVTKFIYDCEAFSNLVKQHNDAVIAHILEENKDFFDHCLKYPLDGQQRRSIVSEEDNCLVVSSAGSGKTSSIIGKVKYLTDIKGIAPKRILLISYTNKAAAELTERLATEGLRGYTFHKLAMDIIGQTTGRKPTVCDHPETHFISVYNALLENKDFKKSILRFFVDFSNEETEWERRKNERREQLAEFKNTQIKAQIPDMDGNVIYVRSVQEQRICFALSSLGVNFRYEEPYEHKLDNENHSQYRPDFSIYFDKGGQTRRIYLEHFGVDEHGVVPNWFAQDQGISYEEANQKYNDGITWKKAAHEKFGTTLLTTSSADFHYFDLKAKLREMLTQAGVPIKEKSDDDLYQLILPKGSKEEKIIIRLVITFINLLKSSGKSIQDVLQQAISANDKRSVFIVKNIIQPVLEGYTAILNDSGQIDFTDAILQATEICSTSHPVEYDYIIVDEFQDISVDRYKFLKVLREGNPPAKLYCVGDDWQSIYRFSGSDMSLFNLFPEFFGPTEINKIETTYRFGEPLVSLSSRFIQRNNVQVSKDIHPFRPDIQTNLDFIPYDRANYCIAIENLVKSIPADKSIFLLGRYSFDDYYLSFTWKCAKEGNRFYYTICGRKIEFLTVHKSKGLEADYVILLQCNKDTYGFPSLVSDDSLLNYVLTESDQFPYGEERRLFYVAITRAKEKTIVLYDKRFPSVFVTEFLFPERITESSYQKHPNANKPWTKSADLFLLKLRSEGKTVKQIATKMGRSQTAIAMRLEKLTQ